MHRTLRLAFLALALLPAAAAAGTLCGTVRNSATQAPVSFAGIFLRTPAGAYTGIHGATDVTGQFCISNVPAGTYDIEVRVDDYRVGYLRGVQVTSTTDVSITAGPGALALAAPIPNPARDRALIRWRQPANADRATLTILDAAGRALRGWTGAGLPAGEHSISWDLKDAGGRALAPGTYFIRLEVRGESRLVSIVRIR